MKAEHKDIIERAKLHDLMPSEIAHELLVRDLVEAALFELKNVHSPYSKLNEGQQQEVIDRITEKAKEAARAAVSVISSRNVSTIEVTMKEVKFNSKQLTLTSIVDAKDPNRHDLIDSAGRVCLLVMAPNDYEEALDSIQPERDQRDLPLHSSELTGNLFQPKESDEPSRLGSAEELDALVNVGRADDVVDAEFKEFGEFSYEEATQIVVLHATVFDAAWLQRRLAIDSEQAITLLLCLVDENVITLETEGEQITENTYKVVANLDSLTME